MLNMNVLGNDLKIIGRIDILLAGPIYIEKICNDNNLTEC